MTDLLDRLKAALSDRYAIQEEIGAGGMATVYLAEDLKHHRKVAVKVLRPELAAAVGAERFLQEIRVTANLHHPHILPLFDSGEDDGFLYFVMPYVEGESLRAKLNREKPLAIDEALEIAKTVAGALGYAHEQAVVHRDIKPENVLLHKGEVFVADFGIAKAVRTAGGTRLTDTGFSPGTPHYMSPEQAGGEANLDGRSDLYSLACVLFEMLVGEPPFTGPSVQAILARQMNETSPSLRVVRAAVPEGVEQAVKKALEKVPADRFSTMERFADALTAPTKMTSGERSSSQADFSKGSASSRTEASQETASGLVTSVAFEEVKTYDPKVQNVIRAARAASRIRMSRLSQAFLAVLVVIGLGGGGYLYTAVLGEPLPIIGNPFADPSGGESQCVVLDDSYNADGSCFDTQARPLEATLVSLTSDIQNTPSPVLLGIKINADGSVVEVQIVTASNTADFTILAVEFAKSIEYSPATKDGDAVATWTRQIFRPGRR